MNNNTLVIVIGVFLIFLFVIYCINKNKPFYPAPRENAKLNAYHFGFPTHGYYNHGGGPLRGWPRMWSNYGYGYPRDYNWFNPYGYGTYGYGPGYYRKYVKPYLTGTCYSSSETDSCRVGYSKTRKDSDGDGDVDADDDWLCCRDRDLF